ncbi:MAG: POT family MFS transporter [Myxococcales bacterium]
MPATSPEEGITTQPYPSADRNGDGPAARLTADGFRTSPDHENTGWPPGVPYIIGNEACERFSFYGMKAILFVYMASLFQTLGMSEANAKALATERVHLFIAGVYAFPMIGALVADRLLGKYRTILYLSLVYCAGHAALAIFEGQELGLYLGLGLIAVGSGGIKPCVSANVGDQFTAANGHLVKRVFQWFYFIINFGSFFSTLLTPWLYDRFGPSVAFGIPGVLMGIATLVFWLGRDKFVKIPPKPGGKLGLLDAAASIALFMVPGSLFFTAAAPLAVKLGVAAASGALWLVLFKARKSIAEDTGFLSTMVYAVTHQKDRKPGEGFFDVARARYGDEAAEGPPAVLRIIGVFAMVSVFWALFDQHSSSWINQAQQLDLQVGPLSLKASQIAALNPMMVMLIIFGLNFGLYPMLEKRGISPTPLQKMTTGMFLAAASFAIVALLQMRIDAAAASGEKLTVLWQVLPYFVITVAEVLVSATGLEFAYTQAPRSMKSTIMGFWLLSVTVGNLLVAFLAGFKDLSLANFFWVFAGLMALAAGIFAVVAFKYRGKTYLQEASSH